MEKYYNGQTEKWYNMAIDCSYHNIELMAKEHRKNTSLIRAELDSIDRYREYLTHF